MNHASNHDFATVEQPDEEPILLLSFNEDVVMAATVRVTCCYEAPSGFEWAAQINRSFHPPHAMIDGKEVDLKWGEAIEFIVTPGESHKLEVYYRAFDVLRFGGAEADVEPLRDGEARSYDYRVDLKGRYLFGAHLTRVG